MKKQLPRTEYLRITPRMARDWLKRNTNNRVIRPAHVEAFRIIMVRGEFRTTHQGVAWDDGDVILDGQHRLEALAQMPDDFSVVMAVTYGLSRDEVGECIDVTAERRNTADVLHVPRSHGEVGNYLARIYCSQNSGITPSYVKHFVDEYRDDLEDLLRFCASTRRTWSSAAMRAAAVLRMRGDDPDYVKLTYRALVMSDQSTMSPIALALHKSVINGPVHSGNRTDLFCRGLKVFDHRNERAKKVQINDASAMLEHARETMRSVIKLPIVPMRKPGRPPPASSSSRDLRDLRLHLQ